MAWQGPLFSVALSLVLIKVVLEGKSLIAQLLLLESLLHVRHYFKCFIYIN